MTNNEAIEHLRELKTLKIEFPNTLQEQALELAIKVLEERPQGEWIISQTMNCHSDIIDIYTCPFCGEKEYCAYPFCHCGADMRG